MPRWIPEQKWMGEDVFIIGGGESLRGFQWDLLRDELTIGCNTAFKLGHEVCKLCVFGDYPWFKEFQRELSQYKGVVFTNVPQLQKSNLPWLWIMGREARGLHKIALGWNNNTGASAINLALILGAKRVYLLGFDMKELKGKCNWHDDYKKTNPSVYKSKFLSTFGHVKSDLEKKFAGCEIINVTDDSDLDIFPKVSAKQFWSKRHGKNYKCCG